MWTHMGLHDDTSLHHATELHHGPVAASPQPQACNHCELTSSVHGAVFHGPALPKRCARCACFFQVGKPGSSLPGPVPWLGVGLLHGLRNSLTTHIMAVLTVKSLRVQLLCPLQ